MTDEKQTGRARIQDNVGCVFVNRVLGTGVMHGVINITLGTFNFTPSRDESRIENDLVVSCRLRLDIAAAAQLREAIDKAFEMMAAQNVSQEIDQSSQDGAALN